MKVSTLWLKDFIKITPPWESVADRLTMAGLEVENCNPVEGSKEAVFEVEVTSNRPDWISQLGVAREIAAIEGLSLKLPESDLQTKDPRQSPRGWSVTSKDLKACPHYMGVLVEGIIDAPTPDFMKERLEACGIRSISLLVDITNYVMLELGQPMHAFDADLIDGNQIIIRKAHQDEEIELIDESKIKLSKEDLIIADGKKPLALAGIMGGKGSEITDKTRNVLLECAFFNPGDIRKSARGHKLSSDSSYRFERRVDPLTVEIALNRALYFIEKYAKPRFISLPVVAGQPIVSKESVIHLPLALIKQVLGCEIKSNQVSSILNRLGLQVSQSSDSSLKVGIPSFRPDLERPIDLIEEIARIYGYDKIEDQLPAVKPLSYEEDISILGERKLRSLLTGIGLYETITFSLISDAGLNESILENTVKIVNPQQKELFCMRPTLITSLLQVAQKNERSKTSSIPIFEIANVYSKGGKKNAIETKAMGMVLYGKHFQNTWMDPERSFSFFDLKGIIETILESFGVQSPDFQNTSLSFLEEGSAQKIQVSKDNKILGYFGQVSDHLSQLYGLKETAYYAEIFLPTLSDNLKNPISLVEIPKFPSISRDLSLVVSEVLSCSNIEADIRQVGGELVKNIELFDFYRGKRIPEGHKNLAFRVIYQAADRTLVSDDIQDLHDSIASKLAEKYSVKFQ